MKRWNRDHFGNVKKLIKKRRLLVEVEKEEMSSSMNHRTRELKREITELTDEQDAVSKI